MGTIYVSDSVKNQIVCWSKGSTHGNIIIGGNGTRIQLNQLNSPMKLSFDRYNNIYIVDSENSRVQKFNIE